LIEKMPRVDAVQPELNDTLVTPLAENADTAREVRTTTAISGLAVQVDIDATRALRSVKASGGFGITVSEEEIYDAQRQLCEKEGVYVEPAGAVSVAGYLKAVSQNRVGKNEKAVCILTGHGLKDSASDSPAAESRVANIDLGAITSSLLEAN
jgi:threonine synthase